MVETRALMLQELDRDTRRGDLYLSERLSDAGKADYPRLLRDAMQSGSEEDLARHLAASDRLLIHEYRAKPRGGVTVAKVPVTAPRTLAEGEFNRFYARALCLRALSAGLPSLLIYRAKDVSSPRFESEAKIGSYIDAQALLDDLRAHQGMDTALGLPPGPNSGLSVRLP